ncbi:substrate-binding periplasmic protein [Niveispirillum sp. KHB5.9]|uniref:substrate-binding periplasmic protein n=1 Tax=Niveispirillum sp. KHB5.9 TaxID=3400269 RepID=UPI003A8BCB44
MGGPVGNGVDVRWLAAAFLCLLAGASMVRAAEPAPVLRLLVADSLPPPYLIREDGQAEPAGLAIALCRKVAGRLDYATTVRLAPPRRVPELMRAGEADMLCHVSPEWYTTPDDLWFGRPLYSADVVIIGPRAAKEICGKCALPAELATVIGYEYGERVGRALAEGRSGRRDVRTEENVFRLVEHGRIEYGLVSEYTFHYFARDRRDLAIKGYATRYHITVGVPKGGLISEADLKRASASIRLPQDVEPEYRPFLGLPHPK